ncbi:alternative ribosome rescue aminoacyl-tRNA hydrolase ArfB [Ornithinimicrobium cerasi]|uniref:Ribosome-associated protein n=1 Tax=Ornithinimicrobium cerasi TaxID=2248773 RepID=A0A285VHK6_9MICO|nr:alternative ribosome rescue aminoacyl-tRNA hydrolase ArfB [Ornithinimicrobium cerasi]SOC52021.1 ribosome-associated protein [Ornithinimicrobium cerasi]
MHPPQDAAGLDLVVPPGPGLRSGLVVPAGELVERFTRAGGPGGQGVNTTDSRVELWWDPGASSVLDDAQRERATAALTAYLVGGRVRIVAAEHRSQRRNRRAARDRLAELLREALAPPPPPRRRTRPTRGSQRRRLESKRQRSDLKAGRARPRSEGG